MLPYLQEVQNPSKKYSVVFRGLNYGEGTQDGEFAETHNLSTDQYPCITQRAARVKVDEVYNNPTTLHSKGKLLVIDGTDVYYDGKKVGEVTSGKKQTATIGNYIVIFPDKKYYKVPTEDDKDGEFGNMEFEFKTKQVDFTTNTISLKKEYNVGWLEFSTNSITLPTEYTAKDVSFVRNTGTTSQNRHIECESANFPFNVGDKITITVNGETSETLEVMTATPTKIACRSGVPFSGEAAEVTIKLIEREGRELPFAAGDVITITGCTVTEHKASGLAFTASTITGEDFPFKSGDVVTISGCATESNNKTDVTIKEATTTTLTFEDNTFTEATEEGEITITEKGNNKSKLVIKESTDTTLTFEDNTFAEATEVGTITFRREFPFKKGDAVTITGCSENGNNKEEEIIIRDVTDDKLTFDDYSFAEGKEEGEVTISRTVPDLDFICESNYRLWGTHENTIYSSKFSDPFNFKVFEGLASDSYAIEVGSEGEFTGCIPYSSHICFFKENTLHKLYGTKPSNFQITTVNVYGVQSGSEKSMHIVNEQLLYKGVGGVYAYTGGVPELISDKFGNNRYSEAVACCDGEKYYISMKRGDMWNMFAYDVAKNIWLREDDTQAVDMTFFDGKVYYLDAKGGLYYIDKTADRSGIEWGATFCTMHETVNERKGYSKFHLRMDMSAGAWLAVDIKTDNDLQWRQVYTTHNEKAKTVSIPIMPTRCDSIDIRLRGKGKCTIKAFIREFTVGSDV